MLSMSSEHLHLSLGWKYNLLSAYYARNFTTRSLWRNKTKVKFNDIWASYRVRIQLAVAQTCERNKHFSPGDVLIDPCPVVKQKLNKKF